jgi:ArsR family transcriptional regulator, arsenate/arsenite/antimonite-responsive transcriptional repressor
MGLPSPTLSFHLNQLKFAGMVSSRRASRSIIYCANFKAMQGLIDYLTENCCGGRPELCAPAAAACGPVCASQTEIKPKRNRRAL